MTGCKKKAGNNRQIDHRFSCFLPSFVFLPYKSSFPKEKRVMISGIENKYFEEYSIRCWLQQSRGDNAAVKTGDYQCVVLESVCLFRHTFFRYYTARTFPLYSGGAVWW